MTDTLTEAEMHLTDGEIVRLLDGEGGESERQEAEAHLATCLDCRRRQARVREWSDTVSDGLRELDRDPTVTPLPAAAPRERSRARVGGMPEWMRVAAAITLLVGFVATVTPPVRAWVADQWTELVTRVAGAPEEPAEVVEPPVDRALTLSTRVTFPVPVDVFRVEIQGAPTGQLILEPHGGGRAIAEVAGGSGEEELVVLPEGLRIHDAGEAGVAYRLVVPDDLRRVEVHFADGPPRVVTGAELARGEVTIELGTADP